MKNFPLLSAAFLPLLLVSCSTTPLPPQAGGPLSPQAAPGPVAATAAATGGETDGSIPNAPLEYALGKGSTADGISNCSLSASAPSKSPLKRQQLQFAFRRTGPAGWVVQRMIVQTGASKSQADLQSLLAAALRKSGGAARGDELAKIGDIRFGGELRLVADGNGGTSFLYNPGMPDGNPTLSAEEGGLFANLLSR